MFSDIVRTHAVHPKNRGELPGANARASSAYPPCGDRFHLFLTLQDRLIQEATFQAQACAPVVAMGSVGTELLKGKTLEQARQLSAFDLDVALGGLPPAKRHAILLFLDALHQATTSSTQSQPEPDGSEPNNQEDLIP